MEAEFHRFRTMASKYPTPCWREGDVMDPRKPIFDAIRSAKGALSHDDVDRITTALDASAVPRQMPMGRRTINTAGLDLIKSFEGMKLAAYKCPAGIWTIGYGSTGPHVKPGMTITAAQAEDLLRQDLRRFEECVARTCPAATDNQFAAMVSLAFNIGCTAFERSTVARQHNAGNHKLAAAAFGMWIKAAGKTLAGLVRRRAAEAKLYGAAA